MSPEPYVDGTAAAAHLAVSPRTIEDWVHSRKVPFHKVGRCVRFRYSELDAWVARQTAAVSAAPAEPAA